MYEWKETNDKQATIIRESNQSNTAVNKFSQFVYSWRVVKRARLLKCRHFFVQ